ncbi:hypothetical protein [Sulfuracidifex metallicus]|uniref:hypothetical protein n=1 Tax=Sulfuracidifex metallicus TaxID=47303 RepID=UPI002274C9BB|nr:hypothetical protein [Sulfuracidifex metallicus]MCY0851082.1 hypothetical protein [Sulfuracidifex metallicus]
MMKVLIFEGLDGVGKTTLSKKLSEKWGIRYVHFPLKGDPNNYDKCTFLSDMYMEMIGEQLLWRSYTPNYFNKLRYFIVDRWALSTIIYNKPVPRWKRQFVYLLKPIPDVDFHYFLMTDERVEAVEYVAKSVQLIYQMVRKYKDLKWVTERTKIHLLRKGEPYNLEMVEKLVGLGQVDSKPTDSEEFKLVKSYLGSILAKELTKDLKNDP